MLSNPGFENGLTGWSTSSGSAVYSSDSSTQHAGCCSAKGVESTTSSLGRLYQDVTGITSPGSQYQISGWIKTSNVVGCVVIALDYIGNTPSYGWTPGDGYVKEIGCVSGTHDWTFYQSTVFTLPAMPSDAVALWFLFDFNNGAGTAWWDEVSLVCTSCSSTVPSSSIVFTETGLPPGTAWTVSLTQTGTTNIAPITSTGDTIVFPITSGQYQYLIPPSVITAPSHPTITSCPYSNCYAHWANSKYFAFPSSGSVSSGQSPVRITFISFNAPAPDQGICAGANREICRTIIDVINNIAGVFYPPSQVDPTFQDSYGALVANISVGFNPMGIAYDQLNSEVYVANSGSGSVTAINAKTHLPIANITVGSFPDFVLFNPKNGDLYVSNLGSNYVSVIDGSQNKVVSNVTVGVSPWGIDYDYTTNDLYVANFGSNSTSVIDGSSNTVIANITVGLRPIGVTFDSTNGNIYVTNSNSSTVSVIDASTRMLVHTIPVEFVPVGIIYLKSSNSLYVANGGSNTVSVIDAATNALRSNLTVAVGPSWMVFNPGDSQLYVSNFGSGTLSVINTTANKVSAYLTIGASPWGMAYNPSNGDLYVANFGLNALSVIATPSAPSIVSTFSNSVPFIYGLLAFFLGIFGITTKNSRRRKLRVLLSYL